MTDPLLTRPFADRVREWLAESFGIFGRDGEQIAQSAADRKIGLVDLDRQRCLVDERVYESALHRGRIGRAYLTPRLPSAATWQQLKGSLT